MAIKLTRRERAVRTVAAAVLALLFAGSAAATAATAMQVAVPALEPYLAALLASALCVLGAAYGPVAALLLAGMAAVYVAGNRAGLGALRAVFDAWRGEAGDVEQVALGARTLLTCGAFAFATLFFSLLNRREFVPTAIVILLAVLVACQAMGASARLDVSLPGLVAAAAAFALTGGVQREPSALRALIPAALAVAVALMLLPPEGTTWPPLKEAADRVRNMFEQYFNFTEQRIAFSINEEGYDHAGEVSGSVVSMLGGPAQPHDDPVMEVTADAQVLLRGAIRTAYTGYSWVDAAPKNRYLYIDPTHGGIRDRVFSPGATLGSDSLLTADVSVKMLDAGTSTLFVPGLLERFEMDLSTAVYYNTAGEMFLSRTVEAGDSYRLRALLPAMGNGLRKAVLRGEEARDDRYGEIAAIHTQLPEGIEGGVYTLTMEVVQGAENPYDRAVAIMDYLRRNMRYTLDVDYPPRGRDFVSWFLLDSRAGYCSYYASAMAVMGRMAGLPTRYIEGYRAKPGTNILTGQDAHAWAEVYFKGVGWIPFDATGGTTGSGLPDAGGARAEGSGEDPSEQPPDSEADLDGAGDGPTPGPGDEGGEGDEPTPSPDPGDGAGESPTPSPEPEDGAGDDPQAQQETDPSVDGTPDTDSERSRGAAWLLWLLLILLLALLALSALWVRRRLRATDPERLCGEARSNREATMILYRASLTLLSHLGQTPANGEAPEAFARRVAEALDNPDFVAFSEAVARYRYGRKPLRREDVDGGLAAYRRFEAAMGRRERLRYTLTRITRGLGDFEAIP